MARNKTQAESIHDIDKALALLILEFRMYRERVEGLESTVKNGLSHKVNDIYEWMLEQKRCEAETSQQVHETRLLGVKMSLEMRNIIVQSVIGGFFILAGILLTAKLTP